MEGKDIEDLVDDRTLGWSVLWLLTMIGEAANHVSLEKRAEIPLPWSEMVGMRNRLIHGYFDLNLGIVHQTVVMALPEIVETLRDHLDGH